MTPAIRPFVALLLITGCTLAHAADGAAHESFTADSFSADTFTSTVTPFEQTGAGSFAAQTVAHGVRQDGPAVLAALDFIRAGGLTVGVSSARANRGLVDNGLVAVRTHAGYRRAFGDVDLDATFSYVSYPGERRAPTGAGYDYAELSTGLRYGPLSARYNTTLSHDFFGVPGARGSSYLDLGMRRDLGHAMSLALHAGDGRVAGSGSGMFDWRDLKAGLNRKLEGGWQVALNYTRAYGAAGSSDRIAPPGAGQDARPAFLSAGRRALVLSAARTF
ncbi:TorF family putative porin [Massilia sp. 9096]|uniref:TorF family putative porin n=1 Tax=Massilia sp. 9096 TaxID=1500894 RepID=UPI000691767E|nr:TorF family putative porin [Massilia sp. 9096]